MGGSQIVSRIGHASNPIRVAVFFSGAGFITLVDGLNYGYEIIDCLVILMFCFSLGGLLGEIAKLARYRTSI